MKKLVVCCDGTGNQVSEDISNVLKFYSTLRKSDKGSPVQVIYYDPGIGTLALPDPWSNRSRTTNFLPSFPKPNLKIRSKNGFVGIPISAANLKSSLSRGGRTDLSYQGIRIELKC